MWLNVPNPMKSVAELCPLDTFFYAGDLSQRDSNGHKTALNLTSGTLLALQSCTSVMVIATTISSTAELKHLQDCADL